MSIELLMVYASAARILHVIFRNQCRNNLFQLRNELIHAVGFSHEPGNVVALGHPNAGFRVPNSSDLERFRWIARSLVHREIHHSVSLSAAHITTSFRQRGTGADQGKGTSPQHLAGLHLNCG